MQLRRDDVIAGVDTHNDNHIAVAIDGLGSRLSEIIVPTTIAGYEELLAFYSAFIGPAGPLVGFGIEGTGSSGVDLARYLRNQGHRVHETARPARAAQRHLADKNDTPDTKHPAHQLLPDHGLATPKTADSAVETTRIHKIAYTTAPFKRAPQPRSHSRRPPPQAAKHYPRSWRTTPITNPSPRAPHYRALPRCHPCVVARRPSWCHPTPNQQSAIHSPR
jgi:hypothetical protein